MNLRPFRHMAFHRNQLHHPVRAQAVLQAVDQAGQGGGVDFAGGGESALLR